MFLFKRASLINNLQNMVPQSESSFTPSTCKIKPSNGHSRLTCPYSNSHSIPSPTVSYPQLFNQINFNILHINCPTLHCLEKWWHEPLIQSHMSYNININVEIFYHPSPLDLSHFTNTSSKTFIQIPPPPSKKNAQPLVTSNNTFPTSIHTFSDYTLSNSLTRFSNNATRFQALIFLYLRLSVIYKKHACVNLSNDFHLMELKIEGISVRQTTLKTNLNKMYKHEKMCLNNQYAFIPLAFDSFDFLTP